VARAPAQRLENEGVEGAVQEFVGFRHHQVGQDLERLRTYLDYQDLHYLVVLTQIFQPPGQIGPIFSNEAMKALECRHP
jgi:hypothetical protein